MTLVEHYTQKREPYEILLSTKGEIHYHAHELKDGFYVIEEKTRYFPPHVKKIFRWNEGDYTGYQFQYSYFTGDWDVFIYDKGLDGMRNPYRLKEPKKLNVYDEKLQHIIIDIINQMKKFNQKHKMDIYNIDIKYLTKFIQDSKLYMIK